MTYLTVTAPRRVEFDEMVAGLNLSVEVLVGELEETVVGFGKFRVENEFL